MLFMLSAYDNKHKKLKPLFFLKDVYLCVFLVIFLRHKL